MTQARRALLDLRFGVTIKSIFYKTAILTVLVSGCTAPPAQVTNELMPVATPMLSYAQSEEEAKLTYSATQAEPYATFVQENLDDIRYKIESNARSFRLSRRSAEQDYSPQFKPGLRVGFEGSTELTLTMTQILFDSNRFEARIRRSDAEAIERHLRLLMEVNDDVSGDIKSYLSYWQNQETEAMLLDVAAWIAKILETAITRQEGGIGKASEVSLFQLKLDEITTDAEIAAAQSEIDKLDLDEGAVKRRPVPLKFNVQRTPIDVYLALARREVTKFDLDLVKREQRPSISIRGDSSYDIRNNRSDSEGGIAVDAKPTTLGRSAKVDLAEEAFKLAAQDVEESKADAKKELLRIQAQIFSLRVQREKAGNLKKLAKARLDGFLEQFQAGSANLTEATSLADTLKRAAESEIQVKYRIFDQQRELARLTGSFWK